MRLFELFDRAEEKPDKRIDADIDYVDDFKFYVDNNDEVLSKVFFPAIEKQKQHTSQEDNDEPPHHIYLKAVKQTIPLYCKEFELEDIKEDIFTDEIIEAICKKFAEGQVKHIEAGDYDEDK